jgi:O-antigen/teichoic acid export membrane protein
LLTPHLTRLWDLETPAEVVIVAATLVIATLANHGRFYLQAARRFTELSIANTIAAGGRLLFATLLVIIGWNAFGALAGLFIGTLLAFLYTLVKTKHIVPLPRLKKITWSAPLGRELKYATLVLFATGFVTILYTTDVEIIKYFFPPEIAGYYSGIATVARSIFFATGSVAAVLLAYINIHATKKENRVYLFKALAITALLGGGACIIMLLVPNLIVHLLIGSRYLALAPLLPLLALHTLVVALINVFMFYFLALRTMILIPIATVGVGCICLLLFFFHASPAQVVMSFLIGSVASLITLIVTYYNHGRT